MNALEIKCLRFVLWISWTENRSNEWVLQSAGTGRHLLKSVKKRKMTYFGHIMRKKDKEQQGNNPRYYTGCPCKGQTKNELVGQYQTLDGADNGRTA